MGRIPIKIIMLQLMKMQNNQRLVHSIVVTPTLESTGVYTRITDIDYRGTRPNCVAYKSDNSF